MRTRASPGKSLVPRISDKLQRADLSRFIVPSLAGNDIIIQKYYPLHAKLDNIITFALRLCEDNWQQVYRFLAKCLFHAFIKLRIPA